MLKRTNKARILDGAIALFLIGNAGSAIAKDIPPDNTLFFPELPIDHPEHDWIPSREPWQNLQLLYKLEGHKSTIDSLAFSPDSQYLISGGSRNDGYLHVWSMATGKEVDSFRAQRTSVLAMAISPDGKIVASSGDDAGLNLWQWQALEKNYLFLDTNNNILSLLITPDSQVLISAGLDGIRLWDLRTQKPIYTLARFDNQIHHIAIDPRSGYILATGGVKGEIKYWNVRTGGAIAQFSAHRDNIGALTFTPDGSKLISGSDDRSIRVWAANSNRLLYTLIGHTGRITALAVHPSGKYLASASRDGIRLWDLDRGTLIQHWYAHSDWVQSLAFSPNGRFLASGSFDRTIKVWQPFLPDELFPQ
ncbi:WD40 repeat domain-containing protein [Oscillatoria sp. FACHB-1406]|uniref:WD40 repeat domain-containing protein n=1 Tax=Oscillatoria sp. FACHB-1406 TaxID=2692846 RepID=UPI0016898282|nr:WD40 repeat domain-containing protein [Oscillatoria sp. FACHB-1406]MBD2580508.1 WD40 repeat domain-containing protein [Oscillatoria sp. FACHB-1406]